jgi:hypothetical protein
MSKLSQSAIKTKADEWAAIQGKIQIADIARNAALAPILERQADELQLASAKHDQKISKLQQEADAIEAEVLEWLETQGEITVTGARAIAERRTETKIGARVIDVKKFFDAAKSKGEAMWDCVTVAVAKAEKLLGKKEIDAISEKKESVSIVKQLRLK